MKNHQCITSTRLDLLLLLPFVFTDDERGDELRMVGKRVGRRRQRVVIRTPPPPNSSSVLWMST